jgi:hypothetical protein
MYGLRDNGWLLMALCSGRVLTVERGRFATPEIDLVNLSRLVADGSCSGQTLQGGGIFKERS